MEENPGIGLDPSGVPAPEINTGVGLATSGESEAGLAPTHQQALKQQFWSTIRNMPGSELIGEEGPISRFLIMRDMENEGLQQGRVKLSAEDANKLYPGMAFTEPTDPFVAQYTYDNKRQIDGWHKYMERAPKMGAFQDFIEGAGVGIAAGLANPLVWATGGASSLVVGAEAGVGAILASNLAQNLALDLTAYPQLKREQQDVTLLDTVIGSATGALAGTALHFAVFKPLSRLFKREEVASAAQKEEKMRVAVAQAETGKSIDVSKIDEVHMQAREGKIASPDGIPAYEYTPMAPGDQRPLYAAADSETGVRSKLGADYGEGLYLTDNGSMANNHGDVRQFDIGEMKLLDTEIAIDTPEGQAVLKALANGGEVPRLPESVKTVGDVLNLVRDAVHEGRLSPEVQAKVNAKIAAQGYDGIKFNAEAPQGEALHNGVMVFDEAKATTVGDAPQNMDEVPQPSARDFQSQAQLDANPERSQYFAPGVDDLIKQSKVFKSPTIEEVPSLLKEQEATARRALQKAQLDSPHLSEEIKSDLEDIDAEFKKDTKANEMAKTLADCMAKEMV